MCTNFKDIRGLGISTRLFFFAYEHMMVLLFVMFFIYSLYAIISNVRSCNYDSRNLLPEYQTPEYIARSTFWVFETSLQANLSCNADTRVYEIQSWLGVAFILVGAIVLTVLKYRKYRACLILKSTVKTVAQLSVFIQNMPVKISKAEL